MSVIAEKITDIAKKILNESFAVIDSRGQVRAFGGDWSSLGIEGVCVGCDIEEKIPALVGLFPWRSGILPTMIPLVQVKKNRYIDLALEVVDQEIIAVVWDVSSKGNALQDLVQKRNELKEANDTLERMADELTKAIQEVSLYHALVGHEIRNTSQNVRASVELVASARGFEEQNRYIGYALGTSNHLVEIVNDTLQTSRLDASQDLSEVDIETELRAILTDFTPRAHQKGLELTFSLSEHARGKVTLDRNKLRFVLNNLIGNALKYTLEGTVRVTLSSVSRRDKRNILIEVRDTGPGFTREQLARSFLPFVSFPRPGETGQGSGLGLFIAKRILTGMGGRLSAVSEPGKGSSFRILLPVAPVVKVEQSA